jgi:hypothetical protein
LLNALGVDQLVLAELQNLPVIKANRQRADQQQGSQHQPQNADATATQTFPDGRGAEGHHELPF